MKLAVLNPGGNDPEQRFDDFAGAPDERLHAPVNFHAFAACTGGSFQRKESAIPPETKAVLLLLRHDLKACRQAMIELRRVGKTVLVSLKEAGSAQAAELLSNPGKLKLFREICERASGAIATTEDLVPLYRGAGARLVEFIPTPYPIEDARWDFSVHKTTDADALEAVEQRGIFLGTREFRTPSRNHLAALLALRPLAESMYQPVTVFNTDGWRGRRLIAELKYPPELLKVIEERLPYPRYLRLMAAHRMVFQLDASAVPGQVAGDALLCRVPCIGGNGAVERLVFPDLCGHGRNPEQLFDLAARLLDHPHDCVAAAEAAVGLAERVLSFRQGAKRLAEAFG
jgi:hypothetical protein